MCRCLTEPGDSQYMKDNEQDCDKLINEYIGGNWKTTMNSTQQRKWNELKSSCGY